MYDEFARRPIPPAPQTFEQVPPPPPPASIGLLLEVYKSRSAFFDALGSFAQNEATPRLTIVQREIAAGVAADAIEHLQKYLAQKIRVNREIM